MSANIWKMYLVRFLYWSHFIAAVLVPFFTEWGQIRFSQILFLNAWFMFWVFLLETPTGAVADLWGRKASIVLGQVTGITAVLLYASYPHFLVFLTGEFLFAFSFTLSSGADEAFIYDTLKELDLAHTSKKVLANMESFKLAGILFGAVTGSFIARYLGLRLPLVLQSIPLAISSLIALTFIEPEMDRDRQAPSLRAYRQILFEGIRYFFKDPILKLLTLDMVVVNALCWLIIWFYQALLKNVGVNIVYFGLVHAAMCIAQILVISQFTRLEQWVGSKKRLLFVSAFLPGLLFILLGFCRSVPVVIFAIVFSSGFGLSRGPLFSNYMNKYIPSDKRATVLSTSSMLRTFSIVLVNLVAGFLTDWSIPYTLVILGVAIVAFSFLSRLREEHLID